MPPFRLKFIITLINAYKNNIYIAPQPTYGDDRWSYMIQKRLLFFFKFSKTLLLFFCLIFLNSGIVYGKRVALVIGNDNYSSIPKLLKAGNDASAIANELKKAGFDVVLHKDLTYRNMVKAIETLVINVKNGDEVAFFFAGHGVQLKTGNYILPIDMEAAESEGIIERTAISLNDTIERIADSKPAFSLAIIDACRDSPFKSKSRSFGISRGLSPIEPAKGQMVVYSASRGQQALDRLDDRDLDPNGVFTREFLKKMKQPGIKIDDLVRDVQDSVEKLALNIRHEQRPAIYNESRGSFYFHKPNAANLNNENNKTNQIDPNSREESFWSDAKSAGNKEAFEAYLSKYPNGLYSHLAKANLTKLCGKDCSDSGDQRKYILAELNFWDSIKRNPSKNSYQDYLKKYPNGYFVSLAIDSIEVFEQQDKLTVMANNGSISQDQKLEQMKVIDGALAKIKQEEKARLSLVQSLVRVNVPTF